MLLSVMRSLIQHVMLKELLTKVFQPAEMHPWKFTLRYSLCLTNDHHYCYEYEVGTLSMKRKGTFMSWSCLSYIIVEVQSHDCLSSPLPGAPWGERTRSCNRVSTYGSMIAAKLMETCQLAGLETNSTTRPPTGTSPLFGSNCSLVLAVWYWNFVANNYKQESRTLFPLVTANLGDAAWWGNLSGRSLGDAERVMEDTDHIVSTPKLGHNHIKKG